MTWSKRLLSRQDVENIIRETIKKFLPTRNLYEHVVNEQQGNIETEFLFASSLIQF